MKKIVYTISFLLLAGWAKAQAPNAMSYQAVIRNSSNTLVVNSPIGTRVSILQGSPSGTSVYSETHDATTNANGLLSLEIGTGVVVSGDFTTIDWANGPYFIQTETDPTGGSSYTITGTSSMMSVPYALYAKTSGSSTPGPQGPQGIQGIQGLQGPAGTNGTNGVGITSTVNNGDGTFTFTYNDGSTFTTSNLTGATGATGATGPQGPIGLTGATGPMGPQGPAGTNGTNGLDGATGPQGPIGLTGATGAQGPVGPAGTNGTNGAGVPVGGTTGQVLSKINGTDFNTQWVTPVSTDAWKLTGNTGTNPATHFIGNFDDVNLIFKVNNVQSGFISANTTNYNTSFGYSSGTNNLNFGNTSIGYKALSIGNGGGTTAIGAGALENSTQGFETVALGNRAGQNANGSANVLIGKDAMNSGATVLSNTGNSNVVIGHTALRNNVTGSDNVVIGRSALFNGDNHNQVTAIGSQISLSTNRSNIIAIGYGLNDGHITQNNLVRIGNNSVTAAHIAGQLRVNSHAIGTNDFTLPATRGTAGQVLQTDGIGATQWVTPSGGSGGTLELIANKVGGSSETLPLATSTTPTTIVFNNIVNAPSLGSYNNATGVFTVGASGGGMYLVQVKLLCNDASPASSTVPPYVTLIKNNATYGSTGADVYYGDYPPLHNVLPTGVRGQGSLNKVVQLAPGDTFRIVAVSANSSTAAQPTSTVAGSNITIIKL